MRQVGLGRRPRDFEPRRFAAYGLERAACLANGAVLRFKAGSERLRALFSGADGVALLVERSHAGIEPCLRHSDAVLELGAADARLAQIVPPRREPGLELGAGIFEPANFDRQRAGAFDQRRVRRLRFGRAVGLRLHRLASIEQPALGAIQLVVGLALIGFDPGDRLPGLFLPRVLRPLLFLGSTALDGDLLAFAGDALGRVASRANLQVEADHRLLLPVLFTLQ